LISMSNEKNTPKSSAREVHLTVTGIQTIPNGDTNKDTTKEIGQYYNRNNTHYILIEDERSAKCDRYKFNHRFLEVVKNGDINAKLYFEAGKTYTAEYRTPYGRMKLTFVTDQLYLHEKEDSISAYAKYAIFSDDRLVSENTIDVNVNLAPNGQG